MQSSIAQVITVRTNRGTEFLNKTLHAYFKEKGIEHQTSTARTPEQNGIVKRRNRTLVEAARTMLSAFKLPLSFWAEGSATACYTQNISITYPHNVKMRITSLMTETFNKTSSHLRLHFCYITIDGENLDKMKEKGIHVSMASFLKDKKVSDMDNTDPVPPRQICSYSKKTDSSNKADSCWIEASANELHQFDRLKSGTSQQTFGQEDYKAKVGMEEQKGMKIRLPTHNPFSLNQSYSIDSKSASIFLDKFINSNAIVTFLLQTPILAIDICTRFPFSKDTSSLLALNTNPSSVIKVCTPEELCSFQLTTFHSCYSSKQRFSAKILQSLPVKRLDTSCQVFHSLLPCPHLELVKHNLSSSFSFSLSDGSSMRISSLNLLSLLHLFP
ncbi:retrovirus-related pol polyprotein from transposon TNT 1-94 [Tanacetum coccineum]